MPIKRILIIVIALLLVGCSTKGAVDTSVLDLQAKFDYANKRVESKLFDEGRRLFEEVKREDRNFELGPLAQLRIADTYVIEELFELAVDEYREFLDTYPRHKYASYAQFKIGEIYYNLIDGPQRGYGPALHAISEFELLNSRYPRNPYRDKVAFMVGKSRDIIAEHEFEVGRFYFSKTACHGATERLTGLLSDYPEHKDRAETLYMLAVCFADLGQGDKSAEYLKMLGQSYPGSRFVDKAQSDIEKLNNN